MPRADLGATLLIANPTSHSGRGAQAVQVVRRFFAAYEAATTRFALRLTEAPGDGERFAAHAAGYDTVLALGGDGVIHEVVNGLMAIAPSERPRLGIIPFGSGNDFARTLGMTSNNADEALSELMRSRERLIDLGHATSDTHPEGTYFMETLSFGLDAAIAIDTTERRARGSRQHGSGLFLTSSIKLTSRARKGDPCVVRFDGGEPQELTTLIFAVQNGPTYGGGFRICPDALPHDGLLDVCYNVRHPNVAHLLSLLALARFGQHGRSEVARLTQASHIELAFTDEEPPCQVDGERFEGHAFNVEIEPQALRVMVPPSCPW